MLHRTWKIDKLIEFVEPKIHWKSLGFSRFSLIFQKLFNYSIIHNSIYEKAKYMFNIFESGRHILWSEMKMCRLKTIEIAKDFKK